MNHMMSLTEFSQHLLKPGVSKYGTQIGIGFDPVFVFESGLDRL